MTELLTAARWLETHRLEPKEIDCVIALMLKILDGKCKMTEQDKALTRELYQHCWQQPAERLSPTLHGLIAQAQQDPTPERLEQVYEQRVLAETMISRPVMKEFKARLRREGLLPLKEPSDSD